MLPGWLNVVVVRAVARKTVAGRQMQQVRAAMERVEPLVRDAVWEALRYPQGPFIALPEPSDGRLGLLDLDVLLLQQQLEGREPPRGGAPYMLGSGASGAGSGGLGGGGAAPLKEKLSVSVPTIVLPLGCQQCLQWCCCFLTCLQNSIFLLGEV